METGFKHCACTGEASSFSGGSVAITDAAAASLLSDLLEALGFFNLCLTFSVTPEAEETPAVDWAEVAAVCCSEDFLRGVFKDWADGVFGTKVVSTTT